MVGLIRRNLLTARRLPLFLMIVLLMVIMSLVLGGGWINSQ